MATKVPLPPPPPPPHTQRKDDSQHHFTVGFHCVYDLKLNTLPSMKEANLYLDWQDPSQYAL